MSNSNPKTEHLVKTQWKAGISGNPKGKPIGTKHVSTWIQELMHDNSYQLSRVNHGTPIIAVIGALLNKAIDGDVRAAEVLFRYGYGTKIEATVTSLPQPILGGASQKSTNSV